jgi:hypothetical protein
MYAYNTDINFPSSNVSTHIKNFSPFVLYGINSNNELFQVIPEETGCMTGKIYVMSQEKVPGQIIPNIFTRKYYNVPMDNLPLYIEEMGCVLFISDEERIRSIKYYGNGRNLVQSHASGTTPLINGAYVVITCLSGKKYYQISGGEIEEIPEGDQNHRDQLYIEYDIPKNKAETHDIFIIHTIVLRDKDTQYAKTTNRCKIEYIDRSRIIPGNPIIFSYNGLVIFDSYDNAANFLKKYGSVENYMIAVGLAVTRHKQNKQIEELNKRASNDKRSMVQLFSLMGGTSICSIFTENLIKCAKEGTDGTETLKRLLKILGIGIVGIGGILGAYLLYRKFVQYKDEKDKRNG